MNLSIILCSYNYARYLEQAVSSVAESSYPSFEIILIDDGSTDGSLELARQLASRYPKIRLFENGTNRGLFPTIERALALAQGTYIHFLSADDFRLPGFVERSMAALERAPHIPLCCSNHVYCNERGELGNCALLQSNEKELLFPPRVMSALFRRSNFWIPGHTSIVKREAFERYGGLFPQLGSYCDWFLYHHIALHEGIVYLPQELAVIRMHPHCYSAKDTSKERYWDLIHYLEEHPQIETLFLHSSLLHRFTKELFWDFLIRPWKWKFLRLFLTKVMETRFARHLHLPLNQWKLNRLGFEIKI